MPIDRSTDLCGRCHSDTRFGWQEWQGSTHYQRGMSCATCHDPHSASLKITEPITVGGATFKDASQLCITCHTEYSMDFSYSIHNQDGITCVQCHVTHTEASGGRPAHTVPDHSFNASLASCNTCHREQMHDPAAGNLSEVAAVSGTGQAQPELQQASVTPEPGAVSPVGYAGLAGLIGLAAGMVAAPWLERWYRRVVRHDGEPGDD
jgi:formate-dependent nitrite reductase cytochrome c552 subunit